MALGAEHVEPAEIRDVLAELDVRTPPGHVGRDGHSTPLAGLEYRLRLPLVLLGVEDVVLYTAPLEQAGEVLGDIHGDGADEDGLALLVALDDVLDDGLVLEGLRLVHEVVFVQADHVPVGGDGDDLHLVGVHELVGLGGRRARHAGELVVHPEEVLDRHGGDGLVLFPDLDALFGLDGLVQPLGVPPPLEHAPGELVHDKDLTVPDDVLLILMEERLRPEGLVEVVDEVRVHVVVEVLDAQGVLDLLHTALGRGDLALFLVGLVVLASFQARHDGGEAVVDVRGALRHPAYDERGARLVYEDGVDLVDDGVAEVALDELVRRGRDVVAKVVEAELGVGAVGDVSGVGLFALVEVQALLDEADGEAEKGVDLAHPACVAAGQVVVDGHDVDALAGQGVQVDGHGGRERLALAGLHLRDLALVQRYAAHDLHVEGPHP